MRRNVIGMALEAIDYQDGNFFHDLIQGVQALRGFGSNLKDEQYFSSAEVQNIARIIKQHTKITVTIVNGDHTGPMVIVPMMDQNHPLLPSWAKQVIMDGYRYDLQADIRKIMRTMETNLVQGTVNLKNSTVSGVFEMVDCNLHLPRLMLERDQFGTAEHMAAVILHEVGHVFTEFEYIGRVVTTNNVLAGMVRAMDKTVEAGERTKVFARGADLLRMSKDQREAVLNAKSQPEVAAIVLDSAMELSRAELGLNIYDITGSEQLADQFAARHGAARALVFGLEALRPFYSNRESFFTRCVNGVVTLLTWLFLLVFLNVVFVFMVVFSLLMNYAFAPDYHIPEHNTTKGRYARLMNELTEQLKDRSLSPELRQQLAADYEAIKPLMEGLGDNLPFMRKISYFLSPKYRKNRKFHLLQNELETLGASSLYADAAKLSAL